MSADGYQPRQQSVTVAAGAKLDLGSIALAPLTGNLNLNTLPDHVHYVLAGLDRNQAVHEEGTTPEYFAALPAGNYQITLSMTGLPHLLRHDLRPGPRHQGADRRPDRARLFRRRHGRTRRGSSAARWTPRSSIRRSAQSWPTWKTAPSPPT